MFASLLCPTLDDFQQLAAVIQPVFQKLGRAVPLYARVATDDTHFLPVTVNYRGPVVEVVLAQVLYDPATKTAKTEAELEEFSALADQIASAVSVAITPKTWFGRRSSNASLMKPIMPRFDKSVPLAAKQAAQLQSYLGALPAYQRLLAVKVNGATAPAEEIGEFAEFCGFTKATAPGLHHDPISTAVLSMQDWGAALAIPSVPAVPQPEQLFENLAEAGRRFQSEFGGTLVLDEAVAGRLITGWRNVLLPLGLKPGDDEAREFFPG